MSKTKYLINIFLVLLFLSMTTACYSSPTPEVKGTLEGQVSIGPLTSAVKVGEDPPTPSPEIYAERKIVVYESDGKTEFARLDIDSTGFYEAELPTGSYVIDINRIGIDLAKGLPKEITITENTVTRLDIDIDTGIR